MSRKVEKELRVTTIEELKKSSMGELVELPRFTEDIPFVARLKKPSMLGLAKRGKIPNSLLVKANELFMAGSDSIDVDEDNMMSEMVSVLEIIAEESFIEPTYSEIVEAGIELTDAQLMCVFQYTQSGVQALESFRTE